MEADMALMKLFTAPIFFAVAATMALPAIAQPVTGNPNYTEQVTLNGFDPSTNTYGALVNIAGNPCPDVHYGLYLNVVGVKNADDAKDKVKDQVAKIADDIKHAAATCGSH
jgi:hypothetical protein